MIKRMDNVLIVVDDLAAAIAFFVELGMELEGERAVEGELVDELVGLDGGRANIAVMRTPDGHGRVELTKFHTPKAISAEPKWPSSSSNTPTNAPKLAALRNNPAVALTIDTEVHLPKILLIRGMAELDAVDGIPDEYLKATGAYEMTPERRIEWEAEIRSLYDGMVRIAVTPTWAKLLNPTADADKARSWRPLAASRELGPSPRHAAPDVATGAKIGPLTPVNLLSQ